MKLLLQLIILNLFFTSNFYLNAENTLKNYSKGKFYQTIQNNFLVSTDKMKDNRFSKTVIVIFENNEDGAWGLTINKAMGKIPIALLIDPSLNSAKEREKLFTINIPIFWGGPVNLEEVFILHSSEYKSVSTINYGNISLSKDYKILLDIADRKGPKESLVILGYSGWSSGQLEGEMNKNHWELSEINLDIIFKIENDNKWPLAIKNSYITL
tara:strand:- start:112 stop:747 length:636 start_codon:yes stop_codon:yes gene_type:complete